MTVTVSKPALNLREELSALKKPSGIKGEELLRANTVADVYASLNPTMFRNRIINGDMRIDQRNAGASVTPGNGVYTLDRFWASAGVASKFTIQQNAGSVTPPAGFSKYLGMTSSSAYTIGAGEYFGLVHTIEGQNISDLGWGTSNAVPATLSFWVRSSLTGTFTIAIGPAGAGYTYTVAYTINAANSWEYKTVTIPGPSFGTFPADNSASIRIIWSIGAGSNWLLTPGAWTGGQYLAGTGQTPLVSTNGATFYITGIQFEKGTVATPFEFRPIGTELQLCQRYFEQIGPGMPGKANSSTEFWFGWQFRVPKRSTSLTFSLVSTTVRAFEFGVSNKDTSSATIAGSYSGNTNSCLVLLGGFSGASAGMTVLSGGAGSAINDGMIINCSSEL